MNRNNQYKKQLEYFGDEFGNKKEYTLAPWQKRYVEIIKKNMLGRNHKGKTLLDIATGSGYIAIELSKLPLHVIATDLTPQAIVNIEKYKEKFSLSNLRTIKCYAEKIPLPDKSVDYIVANAILEHIPDEKRAIKEWKRILKPYGKMFITVPLRFKYVWPFLWPINYVHDKRIGHLRRYDLNILKKKFNLEVVKYFYTGHLVKIWGIIISLITKESKYDYYFEKLDEEKSHNRYGASNITVIFNNNGK